MKQKEKKHFFSKKEAFNASIDGIVYAGARYNNGRGRIRTWITLTEKHQAIKGIL